MPVDLDVLDMEDPCAVLAVLAKAELALELGEQVVRSRINGSEFEFRGADRSRLRAMIAQYREACDAKRGRPRARRRRAITAGFG